MNLVPAPFIPLQFLDSNGLVLSGGFIETFAAGTSTHATTYSDALGASPNPNPTPFDSAGRVILFIRPTIAYKFVVMNAALAIVSTVDNITATGGGAGGGQFFNVRDYGAVGDGVTNDAAAFTAAYAAANLVGGLVLVPPGNFDLLTSPVIPNNVGVFVEPGASFTPDGSLIGPNPPIGGPFLDLRIIRILSNAVGNDLIAIGTGALGSFQNAAGMGSIAIGYHALNLNTNGVRNIAIGQSALASNVNGTDNTAVGTQALSLSVSNANAAFGSKALQNNASGSALTAIGCQALQTNTTGVNNTAVGFQVLVNSTTASNNTAMGYQALLANTTGSLNVAIGTLASGANTTGADNTAVGYGALLVNTTGSDNTAIGFSAMLHSLIGVQSVAVGSGALNTSGTTIGALGVPIASISVANPAVVTTQSAHGLPTTGNSLVLISGVTGGTSVPSFNGSNFWIATYLSATTFSIRGYLTGTTVNCTVAPTVNTGTVDDHSRDGSNNVALGFSAGFYETGNNKLFIDNQTRASEATARTNALIYGRFDPVVAPPGTTSSSFQFVQINGQLNIGGAVALIPQFANNAAALAATPPLNVGDCYRNGDVLQIVH